MGGWCATCHPSEVALLTWIQSACASKKRVQQLLSATPATCLTLKWRATWPKTSEHMNWARNSWASVGLRRSSSDVGGARSCALLVSC